MIETISKVIFWMGLVFVLIGGLCFNTMSGDTTLDMIKLLLLCNTLIVGGICLMIYSHTTDILRKVDEIGKTD